MGCDSHTHSTPTKQNIYFSLRWICYATPTPPPHPPNRTFIFPSGGAAMRLPHPLHFHTHQTEHLFFPQVELLCDSHTHPTSCHQYTNTPIQSPPPVTNTPIYQYSPHLLSPIHTI